MKYKEQRAVKKRKTPLILGLVVFLIPMTLGAIFMYEMSLKQVFIVEFESPSGKNVLEIYEVGEPKQLGPSKIRIKYNKEFIDVALVNGGEIPVPENFHVIWESDETARITLLHSDEKESTVHFNLNREDMFETE